MTLAALPKGVTEPCPFCGHHRQRVHEARGIFRVICLNEYECGALGPKTYDEAEALHLWNSRITPDEVKKVEEEERERREMRPTRYVTKPKPWQTR